MAKKKPKKVKYIPTRDLYKNHAYITTVLDGITDAYQRELFLALQEALENTRRQLLKLAEKDVLTVGEMSKFNRLKNLEASLAATWRDAFRASDKIIDKLAKVQYDQAYYLHAWSIDQYSGVMLNWGQLDPAVVREAIKNDYALIAKEGMRENGLLGIRRTIIQGLAQERTYPQMTRELKKYIDRTAAGYERILRTEGQRARQLGQQAFDEDAQRKGYEFMMQWLATLDGKTRQSHRAMDGRQRTVDGYYKCEFVYSGKTKGPLQSGDGEFDVNCRCDQIEVVKDMPQLVRRSRENGVIPMQNYEEWEKNRPKDVGEKPIIYKRKEK